ncbi:thiaminase II [Photobacterium jeanii]|uniref:Aminopyrimidine aminohydrolase n=1 Tax=Photobacterium jeanii TaxID=858640 RepID=A0A178K294_9GAMM|nr:thiaminase II [Photobacterium jeanii]OAN11449.1 thiaminase II [Photobacterium jeanii]PST90968.1 thiaminase II [Photobacterium jeanii]
MNYQDLIQACQQDWQDYTQHTFVQQLAAGTLNNHAYLHYLKQDFLFLKHYARAYALAVYKAPTLADMREPLPSLTALLETEIQHHVTYCSQWGLTESDMEAELEDFGTVAYTRYVLDTGMAGDLLDLYVALAPCAIGYAVIGNTLINDATTVRDTNPYNSWIEMYGSDDFQQGAGKTIERLNTMLAEVDLHSTRGQRLCEIFRTATRMEVAFWQQGLNAAK